jgi:hypothetical protein
MGFFEKTRALTQAEKNLAYNIFYDTIPYDDIVIGDHLGYGDCPWTQCIDKLSWGTGDYYILHVGPTGYPDMTSDAEMPHDYDPARYTFIHELVHVWQGYHRFFKTVFAESVAAKIHAWYDTGDPDAAYEWEPGYEWNSYNVEQQAKIIEKWYIRGCKPSDELYTYVIDHIRNC